MAKLYIAEYSSLGIDKSGRALVSPNEPPINEQVVDFSSGVAASSTFNKETKFIRIHTDADCSILIGESPTATVNNQRMVAGQTEYKAVDNRHKVSAISN